MVFMLGLRHTFVLWQRSLALVQSVVVQMSPASFRRGVEAEKEAEKARIEASTQELFDFMLENPDTRELNSKKIPNNTLVGQYPSFRAVS